MSDPNILAAQTRRDEINLQLHRAEAQAKENHRAWVCEGVRTELTVRVTLDAQIAQLKADKVEADIDLAAAKNAYADGKRADHFAALVKMLHDLELGYLVDQAKVLAIGARA